MALLSLSQPGYFIEISPLKNLGFFNKNEFQQCCFIPHVSSFFLIPYLSLCDPVGFSSPFSNNIPTVWLLGPWTNRTLRVTCPVRTQVPLMIGCAINSAKMSYCFCCCFHQTRTFLFSLSAPHFKLLGNHNSAHKGYSINLALSILFLHFLYLLFLATKATASPLSKIFFFTLLTLVSKENLGKMKDRNPCRV